MNSFYDPPSLLSPTESESKADVPAAKSESAGSVNRKRPAENLKTSFVTPEPKKPHTTTSTTRGIQTSLEKAFLAVPLASTQAGSIPSAIPLGLSYNEYLHTSKLLLQDLAWKEQVIKEQVIYETFLNQIKIKRQSPDELISFLSTPCSEEVFRYLDVKLQHNAQFFQTAPPALNPSTQRAERASEQSTFVRR